VREWLSVCGLATCPGDPAFALCQLGLAPAPRDPNEDTQYGLENGNTTHTSKTQDLEISLPNHLSKCSIPLQRNCEHTVQWKLANWKNIHPGIFFSLNFRVQSSITIKR